MESVKLQPWMLMISVMTTALDFLEQMLLSEMLLSHLFTMNAGKTCALTLKQGPLKECNNANKHVLMNQHQWELRQSKMI